MKDELLNTIERLYGKGDFQYILAKYIDKQYWDSKINNELEQIFVDNLTDFSYSTCFSYFIQSSLSLNFRFGSNEFNDYLKEKNEITGVMVLISVIAPYSVIKYVRYNYIDGAVQLYEAYSPLNKETERNGKRILEILNENGIKNLDETILNIVVPNVSLELKEEDVTIFNCLFEDSY
ncbi:hypothetical protein [Paenibacillus durus]|uniref:Uncharacterized protein n=1 Tax=Paenibacillus durus ATCC 35681 TaxID=1333534 RepID=A0A0F7FDN9_PAEDU|nr:hypothetical protein [Paenibacillus durus]AKG36653.1 hypothetical protein VK70_20775 [Paenibacillus durus ATCC 35681]